jgi:hypothetical protein
VGRFSWQWIVFVPILAAMGDGFLPGASLLLGSMGFLAPFLWYLLALSPASVVVFGLGLLLDGTHLSIPFGFNAFFGLGAVFALQIIHRHVRLDAPNRFLGTVFAVTVSYYAALSRISPSITPLHVFLSLVFSCIFNGFLGKFSASQLPLNGGEKNIDSRQPSSKNRRQWQKWTSN